MSSIIINHFPFKLIPTDIDLYISLDNHLFFKKKLAWFKEDFEKRNKLKLIGAWLDETEEVEDETDVFYGFEEPSAGGYYYLKLKADEIKPIRINFIKFILLNFFKENHYITEPFPIAASLSAYKKIGSYNDQWSIFRKIDFSISTFFNKKKESWENSLGITIKSNDTLISNEPYKQVGLDEKINGIHPDTGLITKSKFLPDDEKIRVIANKDIRNELNIKTKPKQTFYKNTYTQISEIYKLLLENLTDQIKLEAGGFKTIHPADINDVSFEKNEMLFGNNHKNISAPKGMQLGGALDIPEEVSRTKLLFIFPESKIGNQLYKYFKSGLRHFPGLMGYVGIPVALADEHLEYGNDLAGQFSNLIENGLSETFYPDYLAVIITPFSKETATPEESALYYRIKQQLLEKEIASQFIDRERINSGAFHFHLPNIAVALLAKRGGIPWKLNKQTKKDLVVGFNEKQIEEKRFIGSSIYFDNSGEIKGVRAFAQTENRTALIKNLRDSIQEYLDENDHLERLIIHYYKVPNEKELGSVSDLLREELRQPIPFAFVEINDAKSKSDICFDTDYDYGMPKSGTFIKLKRNEYLLFNNERYWEKPTYPIRKEEYPLKIRLHNTESGGFTHKELISQVYEFSRLYWKGLKQKSQPVTTLYSKLIADFAGNFEGKEIPANNLTQKTVWFV